MDESILFSLGFFSQNSLWKLYLNCGYKGIYIVGWEGMWNSYFAKQDIMAAWPRDWVESQVQAASKRPGQLELLSCSEQLARRFNFWHAWHVCFNLVACGSKSNRESLLLYTHLSNSSHTLSLHDSHINTGFLIDKIQENLVRNKAKKMVD